MRPTLLIADDHQLFAESLRSLLSPSYDVVGIATNGRELIELAMRLKPDLILTDLSMPVLNGLDAVQNLTAMGLRSKFVVLTMHADMSLAVLVFRAGASAFVLKTASGDELKEAIADCVPRRILPESAVSLRPGHGSGGSCPSPRSDKAPQLTQAPARSAATGGRGKNHEGSRNPTEHLDSDRRILQI